MREGASWADGTAQEEPSDAALLRIVLVRVRDVVFKCIPPMPLSGQEHQDAHSSTPEPTVRQPHCVIYPPRRGRGHR
jgi:hypothetical protein